MTGALLQEILLGLIAVFVAVATPVAAWLGKKAADFFEQKTKISKEAGHREAIEWATTKAITAVDEWARTQVAKPSNQEKLERAAAEVRSLAPAAADAVGEALKTVINANVPVVRAAVTGAKYVHTASSLPPPDRVDLSKVGALPRPPKVPT